MVDFSNINSKLYILYSVLIASTECHDGKVLCLDWSSDTGAADSNDSSSSAKVYSGGSDCFVKATSTIQW